MPMTDVDTSLARWRADTPGCAHCNHLNNAGAGLMPSPVLAAMERHLRLESEIGGYEAADAIASSVDATYATLAALVHGAPHNMAIVGNATAGFIQALSTVDFAPGDVLVTTRCDYTSNQIQYLALAQRRGVEIVHAADLPEGGVDPESVRALARHPRCRLVAVSWVPTNSGLVQDVAGVGEVCEKLGVPYLVDACQAVGQIPIDVTRLHCDYLSVTARKFLRGPRGIGFMYVSDRALARGTSRSTSTCAARPGWAPIASTCTQGRGGSRIGNSPTRWSRGWAPRRATRSTWASTGQGNAPRSWRPRCARSSRRWMACACSIGVGTRVRS